MSSLYRQYRPQTFSQVMGQPHVTKTLAQAFKKDRVNHAYLFFGPRGTGKTTTARILARRLNCTGATGADPCGTCATCQAAQRTQLVDVIEIDAASNRGIDDIRALREGISHKPSIGKYKVYIIDEVHMLTGEAFAALLKTLEEPVKHAVFVLATTELHKVPGTILSRCQVFRFRRATPEEMRERLAYVLAQEKRTVEDGVLDFIIARSDGCYRDAESLLGQMLTLQPGKVKVEAMTDFLGLPDPGTTDAFLGSLVNGQAEKALALIEKAHAEGIDTEQFAQEVVRRARDIAVAIATGKKIPLPFEVSAETLPKLSGIVRSFLQALQDLAYVPEPKLALQLAILTVARSAPQSMPLPQVPSVRKAPLVRNTVSLSVSDVPKAPSRKKEEGPGLQKIIRAWQQVILALKEKNRVAATFLRALEPVEFENQTVMVRVQYPLHRNFFEKPANNKLVADALTQVLGEEVKVRFHLQEQKKDDAPGVQEQARQREQELYTQAQEIFGKL